MERRPIMVSRPLLGISVLTLLLCAGAGFLAVMTTGDPAPVRDTSATAYRVDSLDLRESDVRHIQQTLPAAAVVPYAVAPDSGHLVLDARCEDVRRVVRVTCDPVSPYRLDDRAAASINRIIGVGSSPGRVEFAKLGTVPPRGNFVIVPRGSVPDGEVRRAVAQSFVAPIAVTPEDLGLQRTSPLIPWLYGGLTAAALCIGLAALIMAADGFLRARRENEVLRALGLTPFQMTKFEVTQFGFAYGATVGTSFLVGCMLSILLALIGDAESVPWPVLGTIFLGLMGGALAAATSLVFFGRIQSR